MRNAISINPFSGDELRLVLANNSQSMQREIERLSDDQLLSNSKDYLVEYIIQSFVMSRLEIGEEIPDRREQSHCKISKRLDRFDRAFYGHDTVEVDGVRVRFAYPFEGDYKLFTYRASTFSLSGYPSIEISDSFVILTNEYQVSGGYRLPDAEEIARSFSGMIAEIRRGAEYLNKDIDSHNASLPDLARRKIEERQDIAMKYVALQKSLEIPIVKTEGGKQLIPVKRKKLVLANNGGKYVGWHISDVAYLEILQLIKACYSTCERTPGTYASLPEEALRDLALAPLNMVYEGRATGETFRNKGKTDICIEEANRAAFVAECKIWNGPKKLLSACDQLLGYLTWRDVKTALIVFSKRRDFKKVVESARMAMEEYPSFRRCETVDQNEYEYTLATSKKPGEFIKMRLMLFDIHCEEDNV